MGFRSGNCVFTGEGFSPISGFRIFVFFFSAGDGFSLISGLMNILCTPEKPLLQVLPIIQVSSVLKELPVLSLIVLVRAGGFQLDWTINFTQKSTIFQQEAAEVVSHCRIN